MLESRSHIELKREGPRTHRIFRVFSTEDQERRRLIFEEQMLVKILSLRARLDGGYSGLVHRRGLKDSLRG